MMSLYGRYLAEREGFGIVEREAGFANYKVQGEEIYLRDIYVIPALRKHGIARELADAVAMIGKKAGCKTMIGSVSPQDPAATENLAKLLAYGMRLKSAHPDLIVFSKEL